MTDFRIPPTPDTLTRDQIIKACQALSLDPNYVKDVHLTPERVDVELFAIHSEDAGFALAGEEFVTCNVSIPVEREAGTP